MSEIRFGETPLKNIPGEVSGDIVERGERTFFRIANYDLMPPFFMTVVSGHDHWMYVSSTGGLTCGRRNPSLALFPYETDDRIHDACRTAGPRTVLHIERDGITRLWEPFFPTAVVYRTERNLYKNLAGNRLVFEEINHDLEISFEYEWSTSARFGFIKRATVHNRGSEAGISLLDGLLNVLPCGVDPNMQATRSTLVEAYRQAEIEPRTGAGIYTLSSIPTDRAEPSEALKATCAWQQGLDEPDVYLLAEAAEAFRSGRTPTAEARVHGRRTAYLVKEGFTLDAGAKREWRLVADVGLGPSTTVSLLAAIRDGVSAGDFERDIDEGARRLEQRTGAADAFQAPADIRDATRHYANTLLNVMRGGVFHDGYRIPPGDFVEFVRSWNEPLAGAAAKLLETAGPRPDRAGLLQAARAADDPDLERLALEYLPLTFSRRHGDPSRPWNAFDIDITNADGSEKLSFEGNWRDIFQNWEALAYSFPEYLLHFIAKFVNASTADGYNPYRITREGVDWEVLDSDDPWSFIGYWGDHQIVYLLKLLEMEQACFPGRLDAELDREVFVHTDVPYRIRAYEEMLANPRDTVTFDTACQARVETRVAAVGADGRLCVLPNGAPARASLLEKLLLSGLTKLANVVPGGGVWMNTQRPEWNDANNALVGYGLSMVTLCYLRRYLQHLSERVERINHDSWRVSAPLARFAGDIASLLERSDPALAVRNDTARRKFVDEAGAAAERYREQVYAGLDGSKAELDTPFLEALFRRAIALLDESIAVNRREDGLYHAYNLLNTKAGGLSVDSLPVMLEGQVAVLSSGVLTAENSLALLDALRDSDLYREDQGSYLLYPARELPGFLERNVIPSDRIEACHWLAAELAAGRTGFVERDAEGRVHFDGRFRNAETLRDALVSERGLDEADIESVCDVFESVFEHRRFTGRSGTMFKYEGLGCIYWHMVSKLLLVTGEISGQAGKEDPSLRAALLAHYDAIKAGIGAHKPPADYGAFPTDPYSHTTGFSGVQQPGMTGQVKEDVISRFIELGVRFEKGRVKFQPAFLRKAEFSDEARSWRLPTQRGERTIELPPGSLGFTLCGVPVVYRATTGAALRLHAAGGMVEFEESGLNAEWTGRLFARDGAIDRIEVDIDTENLR